MFSSTISTFRESFTFKIEAVCSSETCCKNHKDSLHLNTAAAVGCLVVPEGPALFSVTDYSLVRFFITHVMWCRHEMM